MPLGTYNAHKEVELEIKEDELLIYDVFRDVLFAKHKISLEKGQLIRNNNHLRNTEEKVKELKDKLLERLAAAVGDREKAEIFLEGIRREKARYVRDQYKIIEKTIGELDKAVLTATLEFCIENGLYSALDFRDAAEHFKKLLKSAGTVEDLNIEAPPPPDNKLLYSVLLCETENRKEKGRIKRTKAAAFPYQEPLEGFDFNRKGFN